MSSLSFTQFLPLPRCNLKAPLKGTVRLMLFTDRKVQSKWVVSATSNKPDEEASLEVPKKTRTRRGRKKAASEEGDSPELLVSGSISDQEGSNMESGIGDVEKPKRRGRKKAVSTTSSNEEETTTTKGLKRGRKSKKLPEVKNEEIESEVSDIEDTIFHANDENDDLDLDLELKNLEQDDISASYSWPPLICCFGATQHLFVPSGKPANRLIDYSIHESLKDALWGPDKFIRAPGRCAGSVAIALAKVGGRVAFMGKLGDDLWGESMLYYLNVSNVQTRSVCVDDKRSTAVSQMRVAKRGHLRATSVKNCAEDSLLKSEINIDVMKEAKMFYVNTSSLLDPSMRTTTLRAIKIAKKLGQVIFYDLNLPLPLWHSSQETKSFIQQVWNIADFIEVTKQELEFLCEIKPSEEFDTKNNKADKFVHYEPDVVNPLWHENLKVLFVSNGTSKIHYYTKEDNGFVRGVEDAPVTPFTQDMSASGDGIVAALMKMLTVQPHLITDKGYLEHSIKYAISCGVIDQWIVARQRGFPAIEDMDEDEEANPDPNELASLIKRDAIILGNSDSATGVTALQVYCSLFGGKNLIEEIHFKHSIISSLYFSIL